MCSSRSCSFIARISEGRAANRTPPEFSGGGRAEAGVTVTAGSGVAVTATSSVMVLGDVRAHTPDGRLPEDHDLRHP